MFRCLKRASGANLGPGGHAEQLGSRVSNAAAIRRHVGSKAVWRFGRARRLGGLGGDLVADSLRSERMIVLGPRGGSGRCRSLSHDVSAGRPLLQRLAEETAATAQTPVAAINLITAAVQRTLASVGTEVTILARPDSMCGAIAALAAGPSTSRTPHWMIGGLPTPSSRGDGATFGITAPTR